MDVQLYLDRIGYKGPVSVSKEVLFELQAAHLLSVPFENLDIHYNNEIKLDIASIYKKVVINRRGGFCYELNGLFYHLLKEIGFDVQMISGRVYSKDGNYGAEYDHLALIAHVDGRKYLVDVGFGKFSFKPLEITFGVDLKDEYGVFRFEKAHDNYLTINLLEGSKLVPQYLFDTKAREFSEFEGMCKFHQTSSESHFTGKKVISIATQNGRKTLNNNQLKITDGKTESVLNFEETEFEAKLKEYFKIKI
ncbi:arylamine N-acetyltransferase family protein [Pontibacter burrus]|uniref:Arylamine N-acetyltransferase n=1 Tax=Pontibacter burrus TaxID=2704466 RepID=A0A6B3LR29_9BACT|nr:arylamine N-acetyltransferase [Pontibacter burrus]NEM97515.1 arylamine N-acetyltransferase [Pontibacter burrus]